MRDDLERKREEAFKLLESALTSLRERRKISKEIGKIKKEIGSELEDYDRELEIYKRLMPKGIEQSLVNCFVLDSLKAQGWRIPKPRDLEIEASSIDCEKREVSVEELKDVHKADFAAVLGSRSLVFISWLLALKTKAIYLYGPVGRSWELLSWSLFVRPYRIKEANKSLPAFLQSPDRFGRVYKSFSDFNKSSLIDLTYSSRKRAEGEALYVYSPATEAGRPCERTVVFTNNKAAFNLLISTYRSLFGLPRKTLEVCDEEKLRKTYSEREKSFKSIEAYEWEDGPFIAVKNRISGSLSSKHFGYDGKAYVYNMLLLS